MKLNQLLKKSLDIKCGFTNEITGLSLNSNEIENGNLFFACVGKQHDGRQFIEDAIKANAAAILYESAKTYPSINLSKYKNSKIPLIGVEDLQQKIGLIAAEYYHHPSKSMDVIGVTGTNGKTSVCHFIAEQFHSQGYKTALLGTVGNGLYQQLNAATHTTGNAIEIQKHLSDFKKKHVQQVAIEASSHGLDQGRLNGVNFKIAVFTNLSRDHLDYHTSMHSYGAAKTKLFQSPDLDYAVINIDDEFGRELVSVFHNKVRTYAYSASGRLPEVKIPVIRAQQVKLNMQGLTASLHTPWGDGLLHTQLLGRFNLSNLLAVLTVSCLLDIPFTDALNGLAEINNVPGRMQLLKRENSPHIIVDYAHTPDALRQVLSVLQEFCEREIWCVFGCGGERDKGKRSIMGEIAETLADHVVLTNDNPRNESPTRIIQDIVQGMVKPEQVVIELDRERAIEHAISCADKDDIILIAGKGHENYQQVGESKQEFNDYFIAQIYLSKRVGES